MTNLVNYIKELVKDYPSEAEGEAKVTIGLATLRELLDECDRLREENDNLMAECSEKREEMDALAKTNGYLLENFRNAESRLSSARTEAARECLDMVFSTIDESRGRICKKYGLLEEE